MTQIKVDNIADAAGTGSPDFEDGLTVAGSALSTLNAAEYYESGTEPSSPKNGAIWKDTANDKLMIYVAGEFKEIELGASAAAGWTVDVSAITSDNITFNSPESTSLRGYAFSADGTKMYGHDSIADDIFQYSLSTPWDISSVTYDGFLSNPDGTPCYTVFNTDGTKAYVLGLTLKRVYQYSMSTPYDLANATYDGVYFSITAPVSTPHGLALSTDGTKMFIADFSSPAIYQYSLSTAFDLSTTSYDSVSFSVAAQEGANGTRSVVFNPEGTQMIICGTGSDSLHQYTLSTGFDLSTASYDGVNLDLNYNVVSVAFSTDGTKCYMANQDTRYVTQYSTGL